MMSFVGSALRKTAMIFTCFIFPLDDIKHIRFHRYAFDMGGVMKRKYGSAFYWPKNALFIYAYQKEFNGQAIS